MSNKANGSLVVGGVAGLRAIGGKLPYIKLDSLGLGLALC